MDQGNTDPNNQNPNNPIPAPTGGNVPPSPSAPSSFGFDSNTTPSVTQPTNFDQPSTFSQQTTPPEPPQAGVPSFMAPNPEEPIAPPPMAEQPAAPFPETPPDQAFNSQPLAVGSNWANSDTPPSTPPDFDAPPTSTQPEATNFTVNAPPTEQNQNSTPTPFNPFSTPTTEVTPSPTTSSAESVPTDFSNLVSGSETTSYIPQADAPPPTPGATQPESLVVTPTAPVETTPNVAVTNGSKGFPKILIIFGVLSLIIITAASAYFILGIGKPTEPTNGSVPAVQITPTTAPQTIIPTPIESTTTGSFSNLPGISITPTLTLTPSGSGSAYDLLRRRQAATSSANP